MPSPDERLRDRIQRAVRRVPTHDVMAAIEGRRHRRDVTRRAGAAFLSVAIVDRVGDGPHARPSVFDPFDGRG